MITWGIVSMCQAATSNYSGMIACRFFLGAAEAGYYPGVLYHLAFWYPAKRLPLRIAIFYSFGVFSGTASGLLAYAISFMNKLHGISGWQWMFILEGSMFKPCVRGRETVWPRSLACVSAEQRDALATVDLRSFPYLSMFQNKADQNCSTPYCPGDRCVVYTAQLPFRSRFWQTHLISG